MKKNYFTPVLVVILLLSGLRLPVSAAARKPNVILILADDLGTYDLGCYGQQLIRTPHIDQLAREGMRFTQHYAGSAVCAPSRDALMTGRHTGHTTIRGNYPFATEGNLPIPDKSVTMAEVFRGQGYTTAMVGKWGLGGPGSTGGPTKQGFDYSLCYLDQRVAHDYYVPYLWKNEEKYWLKGNENGGRRVYSHDVFFAGAVDFVRQNQNKPFFLYLPFTIPHSKFEVPDDAPYSGESWSEKHRNYAAMITRLDSDIGKLMALLKELKLDDNTLVIFTSDNGPVADMIARFASSGPLRARKGDLYEGGLRVPLVARWPGKIAPGQVSDHVSANWDLLPTMCELTGAPGPAALDGISLLPALLGKKQPRHEFLYWEFFNTRSGGDAAGGKKPRVYLTQQAVRMGDWKAVRTRLDKDPQAALELYNLKTDIGETQNVAAQHPDVLLKIQTYMAGAREESIYFSWKEK